MKTCSKWRIKGEGFSQRGYSHIRSGLPDQDNYLIRIKPFLKVFVVADGLGSHKYSAIGSKKVCLAVYKTFLSYCHGTIKEEDICQSVEKEYQVSLRTHQLAEAGTTCIFAAIAGDSLFVGQAGDGLCSVNLNGKFMATSKINTDFTNEVSALSGDKQFTHWKFRKIDLSDVSKLDILLMTDGISEDVLPDKYTDFTMYVVDSMFNGKKAVRKIIKEWSVPGAIDDKTMVAVRILKK